MYYMILITCVIGHSSLHIYSRDGNGGELFGFPERRIAWIPLATNFGSTNFERSASGGKLLNLYSVIFFTSTSRFASLNTLGSLKLMADPD